jgi:hypothetical protein
MMVMTNWTRSIWTDAGQVLAAIDPDSAVTPARGAALGGWYAGLREQGDPHAALDFVAHALSRYDTIVWGVQAGLAAGGLDRADPAVVAVLQWIDEPEDELRRAAGAIADAADDQTPASLLCRAVQLSGGSLAPPDLPPVLPPPDIAAKLTAAALALAATRAPDPDAALEQMLDLGEAMATGA